MNHIRDGDVVNTPNDMQMTPVEDGSVAFVGDDPGGVDHNLT